MLPIYILCYFVIAAIIGRTTTGKINPIKWATKDEWNRGANPVVSAILNFSALYLLLGLLGWVIYLLFKYGSQL